MVGGTRRLARAWIAGTAIAIAAVGIAAAPSPSLLGQHLSWTPPRPLPRAPADGTLHTHRSGARLLYDARLGVYTVRGEVGVYYFADGFIRQRSGAWEFSERATGPWKPGRAEWVPLSLRIALYPS
jgi:hypothetical protein